MMFFTFLVTLRGLVQYKLMWPGSLKFQRRSFVLENCKLRFYLKNIDYFVDLYNDCDPKKASTEISVAELVFLELCSCIRELFRAVQSR